MSWVVPYMQVVDCVATSLAQAMRNHLRGVEVPGSLWEAWQPQIPTRTINNRYRSNQDEHP